MARVMKRLFLTVIGMGVGWIFGVTVAMFAQFFLEAQKITFAEAMGNTVVYGFPGFFLLMVAIVLALKYDDEEDVFSGDY